MEWEELEFFSSPKFKKIVGFLREREELGDVILPPREDILNAFYYTPLEEVKVVIIGQDPYHQTTPQYAHGLAFSVREGTRPLPKSLVNIYRELKDDTGRTREDGNLTDWACQGVLLLNTALTVSAGRASSHSKIGWGILVREVIRSLNDTRENIVYILWGKTHAWPYAMFVDQNKHHVIKSAHPSPLSASRGFFGSKPFSKTNKYLIEHGIEPIEW